MGRFKSHQTLFQPTQSQLVELYRVKTLHFNTCIYIRSNSNFNVMRGRTHAHTNTHNQLISQSVNQSINQQSLYEKRNF